MAVDEVDPFNWRNYGMYGFFADVRNYSCVPPIADPRGIPDDASKAVRDGLEYTSPHGESWLSTKELVAFDYDATFEDRRFTKQIGPMCFGGGATCEPGQGMVVTYREFLGPAFFNSLSQIEAAGVERIVFWFRD